jgi:hypothetical protein
VPGLRTRTDLNILAMTSEMMSRLVVPSMAFRALATCRYGAASPSPHIARFTGSYSFTPLSMASQGTCESHNLESLVQENFDKRDKKKHR